MLDDTINCISILITITFRLLATRCDFNKSNNWYKSCRRWALLLFCRNNSTTTFVLDVITSSFISAIFDFISNACLFLYYHEYCFTSSSITERLCSQMEYRRRYVYFVLFSDMLVIPINTVNTRCIYRKCVLYIDKSFYNISEQCNGRIC